MEHPVPATPEAPDTSGYSCPTGFFNRKVKKVEQVKKEEKKLALSRPAQNPLAKTTTPRSQDSSAMTLTRLRQAASK
jgi:hypothetical protein